MVQGIETKWGFGFKPETFQYTETMVMMIKDFIKEVKKTFGDDVEFKATSKEGKIYRSKGYDKD